MTDYELNKAIAKASGYEVAGNAGSAVILEDIGLGAYFNPCNNWNDLMPAVYLNTEGFKVEVSLLGIEAVMYSDDVEFRGCQCTLPQRALAECLLKVLKSKNERA